MIPNIGPMEIGILLLIALVVFGPKRLPELGRSMGRGIREFKGSVTGGEPDAAALPEGEPASATALGARAAGAGTAANAPADARS